MKAQIELLKEIIELKEQNPEIEIHFCVHTDSLSDDYGWMVNKIDSVAICPWYEDGERIFTDEDEIKERLSDYTFSEIIDDEQREKSVDEYYDANVKQAICVHTEA